ncbi:MULTISPECIES: helix-turn-helix transcriptional regulator [Kribbella]|uniref:LuxR family transcriptional regulator n=1 Tax=Kribbella karoonensis TaxID=324851 RepID=A0ABP4Q469_9ACTN
MTTPLVGRTGLPAELRALGAQASAGVLVVGERWSGLTSILRAVADRYARAVPWEAGTPGAVLRQLLTAVAWGDDPVAAAGQLIDGLGGTPTVLAIDDAQYADPFSLQVLSSAVRGFRDARLVVVLGTSAPDGTSPAASGATSELLLREAEHVFRLEPLTTAEVVELAESHGVALPTRQADRLRALTGGRPGAVAALLDELPASLWTQVDAELPASHAVTTRVRSQLDALPKGSRRLVEAVAVLGGPEPLSLVSTLVGAEDIWGDVDAAERLALVRVSGAEGARVIGPADPMVAAAVRSELGRRRAVGIHRSAAALASDPAARLRHLVAAADGPDPVLAADLAALAEECAAHGEWAKVASLLTAAGRLTEDRLLREARLTSAVDALVGAGDGPGARALIPEVEALRETPLRNAVLGYLAILRGRGAEAEVWLARAWELVNADREPEVAAAIAQRYVLHSLARCHWQEIVRWADRALELADLSEPAGIEAAAIRGLGLAAGGEAEAARATYIGLTEQVRRGAQVQRVRLGTGWLQLALDEVETARAELESAVPTGVLGGSARISLWASAWLGRTQFLLGEWDRALETCAAAEPLLRRSEIELAGPIMAWTGVQIHVLRGEWTAAQTALRDAENAPQDYEVMRIPTLLARAAFAEARADHAGVVRALQPLTGPRLRDAVFEPGFWPWADTYATALIALNRYDDAETVLSPHEDRAIAMNHRSAIARLARTRGRLQAAVGDVDAAWKSFDRGLAALVDSPLRFDRARVEFAYGQALRRAGKRRQAAAYLSAAREVFAALRAETYLARCDRELNAGAARSARGTEDLTPQEQAITELVATGLSNREVAAQLFLSTKTVQYHLTRIYAKLGISTRAELAALYGAASQ